MRVLGVYHPRSQGYFFLVFVMNFVSRAQKLLLFPSESWPRPYLRRSFPDPLVAASLNTPVKIVAPWSRGWGFPRGMGLKLFSGTQGLKQNFFSIYSSFLFFC